MEPNDFKPLLNRIVEQFLKVVIHFFVELPKRKRDEYFVKFVNGTGFILKLVSLYFLFLPVPYIIEGIYRGELSKALFLMLTPLLIFAMMFYLMSFAFREKVIA